LRNPLKNVINQINKINQIGVRDVFLYSDWCKIIQIDHLLLGKTMLNQLIQFTVAIIVVMMTTLPLGCGQNSENQATTTLPLSLSLQIVATGLNFPVFLTTVPGDDSRLFIVEKGGQICVIKNGTLLGTPFLDIRPLVSKGFEQGLLGLAFDPNYANNGRFYINYTDTAGDTQIVRYQVSANPDIAQAVPDRFLLSINQPFSNHNGGNIIFGPDGYLYIGMGDGGSGNDPQGNGQDLTDLLGSVLRIDVRPDGDFSIPNDNPFRNHPSAREELWDFGLRNPWRFSFDRQTGDLYIGDVGQNAREEINVAPGTSGGGKSFNYGWNIMEGTICTPGVNPNCVMTGLRLPVLDYDHDGGNCSVTGGYVYRGTAIPNIQGTYFYGDYCAGWVRSFIYKNGQATEQTEWPSLSPDGEITSFGEDNRGEIYILTAQGGVYRIISN
jgi:hypothetical protein